MKLAEILRLKIKDESIGNGINSLDANGSVDVKNITRAFVSKITKMMKEDVERMIYDEFKEYFDSLKQKCGFEVKPLMINEDVNVNEEEEDEKQNTPVNDTCKCIVYEESDEQSDGLRPGQSLEESNEQSNSSEKKEFIDLIDFDTKYSVKELTDLYNEFHKTNVTIVGFGKLKYIRQHFDKKRETNPRTHKQEMMYRLK